MRLASGVKTPDRRADYVGAKAPTRCSRSLLRRRTKSTGRSACATGGGRSARRLPVRAAVFAALFALAVLLVAPPLFAREMHILNFHSDLVVLPDSTLDVTETIRVEFSGSWQGLFRTIPVEYDGPGGFNYSLFLSDVRATEAAATGEPLRIEKQRQGGNLEFKIYVPNASDATRVIVLHYRVQNGLRYFDDHDELYWNVTGTDWQVPIGNASAHIILPQGVTGLHAADYTGVYGSRAQDAAVETLGSNVDIRTTRSLAFREGLTVVVGWDKGFVHAPSLSEKIAQFALSNWPLAIPLLAFPLMFWLWRSRGRDPRVGAIAVQYEPPAGLSPGEAGTLVDNTAAMRDITATIVDLAVRGYLTIEEQNKEHLMGLYANKEYVFHLQKKPAEWGGTKPHEMLLLGGLFDNGASEEVSLSELQNKFYRNLPAIRDAILDALVERGYYAHRPDRVRQSFVAAGFVVGVLLFFARAMGVAAVRHGAAAVFRGGDPYGLRSWRDSAGSCRRARPTGCARCTTCSASRISWATSRRTTWSGWRRRRRRLRNICRTRWRWAWRRNG